jgi:hypothetical protein
MNNTISKMNNAISIIHLLFLFTLVSSCSKESGDSIVSPDTDSVIDCPERTIDELVPTDDKSDWEFQLIDTFDDADVSTPDKGLEDNLGNRRLHGPRKSVEWRRKEGEEVVKDPSQCHVQVNHPIAPNTLSFYSENGAVMLMDPILAGSDDGYRVSFITDPIKGDIETDNWTSFMLDDNYTQKGCVSTSQFGFSIASNGTVKVYQNGNAKVVTGTIPATDEYKVVLEITPKSLEGHINGHKISASLDDELPKKAYLFLGAEIEKESGHVSWIDELVVATRYSQGKSHLYYYGYYWASGYYGEHLAEVSDYTNFNFIETIKSNIPNTKTHVVQVRWEFWPGSDGVLNPNWQTAWAAKLAEIKANRDKIRAVYLVDEPFWAAKVDVDDYNMVLDQIRADLPDMPIITVFAYPTVEDAEDKRISKINCNIDWVGADKYVAINDFPQVINMNNILMNARPNNDIFLIPQTFFAGTTTDAQVAEINWMYYNEALNNNRVVGILNFGLWTHQQPSEVPLTLEVQKLIGNAIVNY